MAKAVFVADSHLARKDEAVAELIDYLKRHLVGATSLYLLGDVFHYAVGLRPFRCDATDQFLSFLDSLASSGVAVTYVGGNRDYFLADFLKGRTLTHTEDSIDVELFGRRLHLVHGDRINPEDRQYLAWRRFSRSLPVKWGASLLPRSAAARLGDRLESGLARTNASMRIRFPEEACRRYAARKVDEGADLILMGHFHDARSLPIATETGSGELHVIPDWMSQRTHSELSPDGFVLDAK